MPYQYFQLIKIWWRKQRHESWSARAEPLNPSAKAYLILRRSHIVYAWMPAAQSVQYERIPKQTRVWRTATALLEERNTCVRDSESTENQETEAEGAYFWGRFAGREKNLLLSRMFPILWQGSFFVKTYFCILKRKKEKKQPNLLRLEAIQIVSLALRTFCAANLKTKKFVHLFNRRFAAH